MVEDLFRTTVLPVDLARPDDVTVPVGETVVVPDSETAPLLLSAAVAFPKIADVPA